MMKRLTCLVLLFSFSAIATARAQGQNAVAVSLLAPTQTIAAASEVEVTLVALNPGANEVSYVVTSPIQGRIVSEHGSWPVELTLRKAALPRIAPGGYVARSYLVSLPPAAEGRVVLELTYPQPTRAVIDITRVDTAVAQMPLPAEAKAPLSDSRPAPAVASIARTFPGRFTAHQPIYFLYGVNAPAVKFQLSFKYRLLGEEAGLGTSYPLLQGIHVGYTQRSLWDIQATSSPFYDTSYMPELMYEVLAPGKVKDDGGFQWLGAQAAFQHESNGRDGLSSRSMNIFYVRPAMALGELGGWHIVFAPKFFTYVGAIRENPDIAKYRGYSELFLTVGKNDGLLVTFNGRVGKDFDRGSLEVNASYPLRASWGQFATYGFVQYFTGYGESLLHYNQKSSTVRAGFSFIR